jgi:two-component system response regulator
MRITGIEILLVDDRQGDAEMMMRAIRHNKVTSGLIYLRDGRSALDFMFGKGEYEGRDLTDTPKVIFLDVKMPKISGIDVLKVLKSNDQTMKIPVVMVSSSRDNDDIENCYALGANSYIVKPEGFEDFIEVVTHTSLYWILHNQSPN